MSKEKTLLKFKTTVSDPTATWPKGYKFQSGIALETGEVVSIQPVDLKGEIVDMMIEVPMSEIPALLQTLITMYEEYQTENPYLPKLQF